MKINDELKIYDDDVKVFDDVFAILKSHCIFICLCF